MYNLMSVVLSILLEKLITMEIKLFIILSNEFLEDIQQVLSGLLSSDV